MAYHSFKQTISERLAEIRAAGLYKSERQILGPQGAEIRVAQGEVLNLCANNYLGLANHPEIRQAAAA
ncbi:MAG TPA: glycine C-acetyltransferase, partial [Nitrospiraceae bacterium]|nr:glycine C-acetyltransferase [Nitrospiraceae bacterium]